MSTFCYTRDFQNRDQWLGGYQLADDRATSREIEVTVTFGGDGKVRRPQTYDKKRGSSRRKAMTLRSWRDQSAIGGPDKKCAIRKMERRRPSKRIQIVQRPTVRHPYLQG